MNISCDCAYVKLNVPLTRDGRRRMQASVMSKSKELVQFGKQIGPSSATLESTRIQDLSAARTVSWR